MLILLILMAIALCFMAFLLFIRLCLTGEPTNTLAQIFIFIGLVGFVCIVMIALNAREQGKITPEAATIDCQIRETCRPDEIVPVFDAN